MSQILHIRLPCKNCSGQLRVAAEHAGKYVQCPRCGNIGPIPSLEECQSAASEQSVAPGPVPPGMDDAASGDAMEAAP